MRALDIDPIDRGNPEGESKPTGSLVQTHMSIGRVLRRMRDIKELLHDVWEQGETITNIVTSSRSRAAQINLAATTDCRRLFNFLARYSAASARAFAQRWVHKDALRRDPSLLILL